MREGESEYLTIVPRCRTAAGFAGRVMYGPPACRTRRIMSEADSPASFAGGRKHGRQRGHHPYPARGARHRVGRRARGPLLSIELRRGLRHVGDPGGGRRRRCSRRAKRGRRRRGDGHAGHDQHPRPPERRHPRHRLPRGGARPSARTLADVHPQGSVLEQRRRHPGTRRRTLVSGGDAPRAGRADGERRHHGGGHPGSERVRRDLVRGAGRERDPRLCRALVPGGGVEGPRRSGPGARMECRSGAGGASSGRARRSTSCVLTRAAGSTAWCFRPRRTRSERD